MATQEPLWHDTVFRYIQIHDMIDGFDKANVKMDATHALNIVATLGIKVRCIAVWLCVSLFTLVVTKKCTRVLHWWA